MIRVVLQHDLVVRPSSVPMGTCVLFQQSHVGALWCLTVWYDRDGALFSFDVLERTIFLVYFGVLVPCTHTHTRVPFRSVLFGTCVFVFHPVQISVPIGVSLVLSVLFGTCVFVFHPVQISVPIGVSLLLSVLFGTCVFVFHPVQISVPIGVSLLLSVLF